MGEWSSQFNLGDNPDTTKTVFFELGYVADWDDFDSPFITLATVSAILLSIVFPSLIVLFKILYTSVGKYSFITESLKTFIPKSSLTLSKTYPPKDNLF